VPGLLFVTRFSWKFIMFILFLICSISDIHHIYPIALNYSLIRKTKKAVLANDDMIKDADVEILRSLTNLGCQFPIGYTGP
jgi:hypothetical protein